MWPTLWALASWAETLARDMGVIGKNFAHSVERKSLMVVGWPHRIGVHAQVCRSASHGVQFRHFSRNFDVHVNCHFGVHSSGGCILLGERLMVDCSRVQSHRVEDPSTVCSATREILDFSLCSDVVVDMVVSFFSTGVGRQALRPS